MGAHSHWKLQAPGLCKKKALLRCNYQPIRPCIDAPAAAYSNGAPWRAAHVVGSLMRDSNAKNGILSAKLTTDTTFTHGINSTWLFKPLPRGANCNFLALPQKQFSRMATASMIGSGLPLPEGAGVQQRGWYALGGPV